MSDRGVEFMQDWIGTHPLGTLPADHGTARILTSRAAIDAGKAGVGVSEIEDDLGPLESVIFAALGRY